jgi:gas vesicle protein
MNRDMFGFLVGLGAGAALGILLAPRSGERTRSLIRGKANEGAAYVRQRSTEVRDAAADAIRESASKVAKGADAVRSAVEAGKQAFNESLQS